MRCRGGLAAASAALALVLVPALAAADEPPPPSDVTPPETVIVSGPDDVVEMRTARFEFESSEPGSAFECSLDGAPFAACGSPHRVGPLEPGLHVFDVRATDTAGNVDATPARREWEVLAPEPPGPVRLTDGGTARWLAVLRPAKARARPSLGARVVARLSRKTPERTTNLVLGLERLTAADGRLWVRVRLPILPNNSTGWVLRGALGGYNTVVTRLVVERKRFRATLYRRGKPVWRARIGVGKRQWPTPRGEFYVRNRLTDFDDPFYGPIAFGTSARTAVLTDWPGGGFIGIHGTSLPELLPGRVSHGCIRLRNADIVRLARLMPVGTPLSIR